MIFHDCIFRLSSQALERAIPGMDSVLRTMQSTVGRIAGLDQPDAATGAPLNGPRDVDTSTAELANRLMRVARWCHIGPFGWMTIRRELVDAVRSTLPDSSGRDARHWLTLSGNSEH